MTCTYRRWKASSSARRVVNANSRSVNCVPNRSSSACFSCNSSFSGVIVARRVMAIYTELGSPVGHALFVHKAYKKGSAEQPPLLPAPQAPLCPNDSHSQCAARVARSQSVGELRMNGGGTGLGNHY